MPKRKLVLGALFLALAIFPAARSFAKAGADDAAVDRFFSAIRAGNFNAATKHFSARMKALSPAGLKGSWNQVYAQQGPLLGWKIFQRQNIPNSYDEISVQLRFHHATANSIVVVNSQTAEITSVLFKLPATAPPYADPTKFDSEDVTVGAYKLPGTLTIPKGKGPFPAVVLIHGAGPNDRDETVGPNHPFADIAEGLSSRGIVVLRYDKRTYALRNLDPNKTTVDEKIVQDGVAALRMLRARPERRAQQDFRHRAQPRRDAGAGDREESGTGCGHRDAGAVGPQAAATDGRAGASFGTGDTRTTDRARAAG